MPETLSPTQKGQWLAGLLEVAGTFYFKIDKAAPRIEYRDDNPERMEKLQEIAGGKLYKNDSTWIVTKNDAVEIARLIKDYAPTRRVITQAFIGWEEVADDTHQSRDYIQDLLAGRKQQEMTKMPVGMHDYLYLVRNKAFLGGVIDARGFFILRAANNRSPELTVSTLNTAVLYALSHNFNKSVVEEREHGFGHNAQWKIAGERLKQLLEHQPLILLRQYQHVLNSLGIE